MLIKKGKFSVVIPACCNKNIEAKMPYLHLNYGPDSSEPETIDRAKPEWRCTNMPFEWVSKLTNGDFQSYYAQDLSLTFCPFCGQKLPEIIRVERMDLDIHVDCDGGYYCGTCDERNMNCECYPEIVLFDAKQFVLGSE